MAERITILGDGAMGLVCAILLDAGGHNVTLWGASHSPFSIDELLTTRESPRRLPGVRIPDAVRLTAADALCFESPTLVVSAVPTQNMRAVWTRLKPYLPEGVPIVSVAKGIENDTLLRPTQIIAQVLDRPTDLAALSGPNIAAELGRRLPATAVVASDNAPLAEQVQAAFSTSWLRVYTNLDVIGTELAGAIKNVIAIAAGILDGLKAGCNAKAALVTRGLVEITRLGLAMGAKEETFTGLAGLGDLITTCFSLQGRNRAVGQRVGEGGKFPDVLHDSHSVAEGFPTCVSLWHLSRKLGIEMPIADAVYAVLVLGVDPHIALAQLMRREKKPEIVTKK